ncbi:MAG: hypothetical protein LiPW15_822 [Parcubacteria group bacterium LiPW_15]|nr:MAG: hypothetical protein LiPW15_822 [Parcubacteria group bacterium LiPW_15]
MTITNKKILGIAIVLVGLTFAGTSVSTVNAATCPTLYGHIVHPGGNGYPATATATNGSDNCTAEITFSAYKVYVTPGHPGWLDTQTLFDSQTLTFAPGETKTFTVNTPQCYAQLDLYEGPAQPHLSDAAGGFPGQNLLSYLFTGGSALCTNTPPPQLSCSPANQNVDINQSANFSANGGDGTYSWSSGSGSPSTGNGANFSSSWNTSGNKTVTVTSGSQTATCSVSVNPPAVELSCQPQTQTINVGDIAVFSAQGGNGNYNWTSPGSPASGVGANFSSAFSSAGVKTVNVTDGTQTKQCSVTVNEVAQNLTCSPSSQTGNVNDYLTFSAQGGSGNYTWNGGGNPTTGNGTSFVTQFLTSGNKTVTVTSGSQTATCSAYINQTSCIQPSIYLNAANNITENSATLNGYIDPQGKPTTYYFEYGVSQSYGYTTNSQTITSPQTVTFSIYGLQPNTTYYYRLVAQSECGTNRTSAFSFTTPGGYTPPQQQIYCNPQNQNVNVNDWVNFNATGGNGNYYWSTSGDASPYSGNGQSFGTRFSNNGTKIVTVSSSNGGSAQCIVYINTPQQYSNFQITKNVLNRTLGQSVYVNNVEAQSQDLVEFEIRVQNANYNNNYSNNNNYYNNYQILVRDALPYGLTYVPGSTRVNNNQVADGLTQGSGIYLNNNYGNQEQIIRFQATVNPDRIDGLLTNQATVTINSDTRSAYATVTVRPRGTVLGAADIVTGPEDTLPIVLALGFASALAAYYLLFHRKDASPKLNLASAIVSETPRVEPKKKTEFEKMLERIRTEEKSPDA